MRRLLQNDGHDEVDYDRPNLPWVCGRAAEGCPCPLGPTPRGGCPEAPDCVPVRVGDHWQCGRPANRGGACDHETGGGGPTPDGKCCRVGSCQPLPSLRRRRGRLAVGITLFFAGVLAMLAGSPWRNEVLAPGPLTQAHARLLTSEQANRCAACHPGGAEAALGLAAVDDPHATQSALCMKCHKSLIDTDHALAAHGLPADLWKSGRREAAPGGLAAIVQAGFNSEGAEGLLRGSHQLAEVACAACHQEHHGAEHDLQNITDRRCQACHSERYDGLGDHPEFVGWPYERRSRINFDHNSHATKHYASNGESFTCAACHVDGPRGETKLTKGYDQACARCHDEGIAASTAGGVSLVSLPMLDRDAIEAAGADLGVWPEEATGDFDGELPPLTKLLLAADPRAAAAIEELGADFDFFDLDPDAPEDARAAAAIAEALRSLMDELGSRGQEAVIERARRLSPAGSAADARQIVGGLPVPLVRSAQRAWFTGDSEEAGSESRTHSPGTWFLDRDSLSLRYMPTGHADPVLKAWLERAVSLGEGRRGLQAAVLGALADPNAAGRCATCHSLEQQGGQLMVNWRAEGGGESLRSFTKFSHRPHVTQPELADCTHCHQPDPTADAQAAPYASLDAGDFVRQFQPLKKAACIECHKPKAAGHGCTQCHNYHVDASTWLQPRQGE